MTTDFRALCAELVSSWDNAAGDVDFLDLADIMDRARAALAQPEGERPTDGGLPELRGCFERILCVARSSGGPTVGNIQLADRLIRAVLARWGRPAPQPIPVSERLPGEGDCDASYRCWFISALGNSRWNLDDRTSGSNSNFYTHWLPYWALPLPQKNP